MGNIEVEARRKTPNEVDKIIGKAKKEVIISLGRESQGYLPNIGAVRRVQSEGVRFMVLTGPDISLEDQPVLKLLDRDVIEISNPPRVSFVVVDGKDIIWQNKSRLGDRVTGSYLRNKFLEAHRKFLLSIPSCT